MSTTRIAQFVQEWGARVLKFLTGPIGVVSTVLSLGAAIGLGSIDIPKGWAWAVVAAAAVLLLAINIPKAHLYAGDLTNRRLKLADLDRVLANYKKVGILGTSSVGKSTFISAIANIPHNDEQTAEPYGVIVSMPQSNPANYVAFVDTVGREYPGQIQAMKDADGLLIFVDHNASDDEANVVKARIDSHYGLVENNITPSIRQSGKKFSFIAIVKNKSDLWGNDAASQKRMNALSDRIVSDIRKVDLQVEVKAISHSSFSKNDNAELVKIVQNLLK